ncbi:MAG: hypothetical protein ACKVWR_21825 [Acidimicrobiales bacterium]
MTIVQMAGVIILTGAVCWVLGWCASEQSMMDEQRRQNRLDERRRRGDRW